MACWPGKARSHCSPGGGCWSMCKRLVACGVLAAGLCVVRGASGQELGRLRFRADSLALMWRDARMRADLHDSVKRDAPPPNMERVQAGALTVLADPSRLPLGQAVRDAWVQLDAF